MTKKSDWEAAYRDLIAEGRQRLGEPPTEEEVTAYLRGELPEVEAARVRELLVHYPELADALGAPFSFPNDGKPGDADYLSKEELAKDWAKLQERIREEEGVESAAVVPGPAIAAAPPTPMQEQRGGFLAWTREIFAWQFAAGGAFLLAALFGGLYVHSQRALHQLGREFREPRTNLEHRLLLPDGKRGGAGEQPPIPLASEAEFFLLIPALINHPPYPDYRIEILDLGGDEPRPIWKSHGLRRRTDDTFEIWVPRAFLKTGGSYRLDVYGVSEGRDNRLETYSIRLAGG